MINNAYIYTIENNLPMKRYIVLLSAAMLSLMPLMARENLDRSGKIAKDFKARRPLMLFFLFSVAFGMALYHPARRLNEMIAESKAKSEIML